MEGIPDKFKLQVTLSSSITNCYTLSLDMLTYIPSVLNEDLVKPHSACQMCQKNKCMFKLTGIIT